MTSEIGILSLDIFESLFFELTTGWTWEIQGFVDQSSKVYPIDSDTKVLSTVFERFASPVIRTIAKRYGYTVENANQTTYPDFTLSKYSSNGGLIHRIAVDVKTTYSEFNSKTNKFSKMNFTLGSYKSFIRNGTKNILFPYSTYDQHWVLGFVYSRNQCFQEYDLDNLPDVGSISCPYNVESIFITDKINLIGLRAGSGNTANIGSVILDHPTEFGSHKGPFTKFRDAKSAADYYWSNYDEYKSVIKEPDGLYNHPDFEQFK